MEERPDRPVNDSEFPVDGDLGRFILESTPHCIAVLDAEFRLVYGNQNFFRFIKQAFGRELNMGDELLAALPKDRQLRWQLRLQEVLGGQCTRIEEVLEVNGATRYFDVAYQPLNEGETWNKVVVYFEEITARKRKEIRLLDREKDLEETLSTRQTLLSVISHDLRSPIFQLNGLLFLIHQDSETRDEARLQMHAQDLEERIAHLTHTLDNLLSWSTLQRQNLEPQIFRFPIKQVCEHAIGLLKPVSQRKGVRIQMHKLGGLELSSDREMVAFIVRNLLNNAIKFSKQGGRVDLHAEAVNGSIRLTVKDQGVGIQPGRIQTLREGIAIPSEAGTWGEQGTGLGLKLCFEFADRLHGTLDVRSEPGKGTSVSVTLPQLDQA
jgi:signal transduction histidine kinase